VFAIQGRQPLGSSKLGRTKAETRSELPARPGPFLNSTRSLEGPTKSLSPGEQLHDDSQGRDPAPLFFKIQSCD
jgi:hypothetical protein